MIPGTTVDLPIVELLNGLPIWVASAVVLMWSSNKLILPIFQEAVRMRNKEIAEKVLEIEKLNKRISELELILEQEKILVKTMSDDYFRLMGAFSLIRSKLKQMGFDDIPLNDFNDGAGNDNN